MGKVRVHDTKFFSCYKVALRLVVLTQTPFAYIERVFPSGKILLILAEYNRKEMVECQIFSRCNDNLYIICEI